MKYCRKEDDVFCHTVTIKTKTKTKTGKDKDNNKVLKRPNMCYIFEKQKVQGYQNLTLKVTYNSGPLQGRLNTVAPNISPTLLSSITA